MKHRGNRISPLEIEIEACGVPGVVEASLLKRESDDTLHLFVTVSDADTTVETLLRSLGETLEPAKVSDFVIILTEMPKSDNGKIDRNSLAGIVGAFHDSFVYWLSHCQCFLKCRVLSICRRIPLRLCAVRGACSFASVR